MPNEAFFKLSADKQERILAAALEEFTCYKDNYEKASVKRIAERAEIAIGSIYKYFRDKNDLFFHLFNLSKEKPKGRPELDTFYDYSKEELSFSFELSEKNRALAEIIFSNKGLFYSLIFENTSGSKQYDDVRAYLDRDRSRELLRDNVDQEQAAYMYFAIEFIAYQYCLDHGLDYSKDDQILKKFTDMFFFGIYKDQLKEK